MNKSAADDSAILTTFLPPATLLVIDEWLLDSPDDSIRGMLLELLERRYDAASTKPMF